MISNKNINKKPTYFVEVGPLVSERFYSGIPNVVRRLVQEMLKLDLNIKFFHGMNTIQKDKILKAVDKGSNKYLGKIEDIIDKGLKEELEAIEGESYAIFTNVRHGVKKIFNKELHIVYDLTPRVTPEFHHEDTIRYYDESYSGEYSKADFLVCISEATKNDLLNYFPKIDEKSVSVSLLSSDPITSDEAAYLKKFENLNLEKYVMVLGTVEPRKNISLVLKMLSKNRQLLKDYRWIIVGRDGWKYSLEAECKKFKLLDELESERIVRFEYVENDFKLLLLQKAYMLIFPSLYEGFGLPVLESISMGCPTIASFSSSIPEVGGDVVEYFDPYSPKDLYDAFIKMKKHIDYDFLNLKQEMKNQSDKFRWKKFTESILTKFENTENE